MGINMWAPRENALGTCRQMKGADNCTVADTAYFTNIRPLLLPYQYYIAFGSPPQRNEDGLAQRPGVIGVMPKASSMLQ